MPSLAQGQRSQGRRIGPRNGPTRVRWDRIGRVLFVVVIGFVMFGYLNPAVSLFQAWRDSSAGAERLAETKRHNRALERRAREAASSAEIERQGRRLGLVLPGERGYVVRGAASAD